MISTDISSFVGLEAVSWLNFHLIASIFHVKYEPMLSAKDLEGVGEQYIILKRIEKAIIVKAGQWVDQDNMVGLHCITKYLFEICRHVELLNTVYILNKMKICFDCYCNYYIH